MTYFSLLIKNMATIFQKQAFSNISNLDGDI